MMRALNKHRKPVDMNRVIDYYRILLVHLVRSVMPSTVWQRQVGLKEDGLQVRSDNDWDSESVTMI